MATTEVKGDEVVTLQVLVSPGAEERQSALRLQARADSLTCTKAEDEAPIADLAKELDDAWKKADDARQFFVRPLNDQVKRVNDLFRPTLDGLKAAKAKILNVALAWRRSESERVAREQRERDQAQRKAADQARAMQQAGVPASTIAQVVEPAPPPPAPEPPKSVRTASGAGLGTRKVWQITSADLSKVPASFLLLNDAAVLAVYRQGGTVPGVMAEQVEAIGRR